MKKIIFKRKIWKRIGISVLAFLLVLGLAATAFWLRFMYIPTPKEIVHFESLGVTLEGTLYYPDDQNGSYDAVIVLQGSGRETRDAGPLLVQSKGFLKKGFAVLRYDKRGIGNSAGTFRNENFEKLVADTHAAIDYLKSKAKIRTIGLATTSESVLFAPQIASERNDISFIYNTVGSVVSFDRLAVYQMGHIMRKWHKDSDAEEIIRLYQDVLTLYIKSDGNPDYFNNAKDELNNRMAAATAKYGGPTLPFMSGVGTYNEAYVHRRGYSSAYDPQKYFEQSFKTPLFYAFAELDINIPTDESVVALDEIISRNEHNVEYKVWPNVGHAFGKIYWAHYGIYPKGYLDEMGDWALKMVNENNPGE
ncbi:MAG: CocE/NonD family hydrolase [Cyclobacteriaceae bacterium]